MTLSLLKTKLQIPHVRPELVSRPRLVEGLEAGLDRKLALVSAPAGFGKTTLLAAWVTRLQERVAWLSLDEGDDDEGRFWTYVIAALQTVQAGLGEPALRLLQTTEKPALQPVLTALLNQVAALHQDVVLVLDDYHMISERAIHEGITFFLEHQPPNFHLVISTRADPSLPIYRLRARGQVTELRSEDLRFTVDEAAAFLNTVMRLDLAREDVEALEGRTEGWIAGLQLAALSLQGRDDAHEFITSFSAGHHYVLEYLTNEIVGCQSEEVQYFLMQTSILSRLCGPLCEALTGADNGEAMLAHLLQRNLFIQPLDEEHHWYRYHPLFADLLGNLLRKEWPVEYIRELHLRACEWYEQNGWIAEAVGHALAAKDYERTATLIERHSLSMVTRGELTMLLRWIKALPATVAHSRPWLCVHQAWPLIMAGKADVAESLVQQIEQQVPPADLTSEEKELSGHVAAMRAMSAMMRSDMREAVELVHRADRLLPPDNLVPRNTLPSVLASASYAEGDLVQADQALYEALRIGRAVDHLWPVVRSLCDLADLRITQGQLRKAADLCQEALQEAEQRGARQFAPVGYVLVKLGEIAYARNDLMAAREHALEGVALMQGWRQPYEMVGGYTALATILQALNDAEGAREALQHAEELQCQHPHYHKLDSMVHACRIRLCLAQDGPDQAAREAREVQLGETGARLFREREQMALAWVLIAQRRWDEAWRLLAQLGADMEAGGRFGRHLEVLVLQASVRQLQGDTSRALRPLETALKIAEPEGNVRVFVEQGAPMVTLLQEAAAHGIAADYVRGLLAALGAAGGAKADAPLPAGGSPLVEPLTPRELKVLQLLGEGCSNREIAEALVITLNGVKKHTSNIYGKLGVHSRTQAVVHAQELGLL